MDMRVTLADYMRRMGDTLSKTPFDALAQAADILMEARENGKWVFAAGNGGSGATASHFVNDFMKGLTVPGKKRFRVISLNDCVPLFTALANDIEYSAMFTEQLKNYARPGDVLVVYSGSGNSPNVVKAAEYAQSIGMKVVGFTGRDGGRVGPSCTVNCVAPTDGMEEIEDVHMVWEHALICMLKERIAEEPEA